jgi:hypothetical protein
MKRILGKLLKAIAVIVLIPGILFWIVGISAFSFRLFAWYKTDQWTKLAIIELIPNRFIVELTTNFPRIQKELYWILNREIIIFLFGLGLILIVSFLILNGAAKRCEEKPTIVSDRLKNLIRNK